MPSIILKPLHCWSNHYFVIILVTAEEQRLSPVLTDFKISYHKVSATKHLLLHLNEQTFSVLEKQTETTLEYCLLKNRCSASELFPLDFGNNYFCCIFQTLDQRERKRIEETDQHTQTLPPRSLVSRCWSWALSDFTFDGFDCFSPNWYVRVSRLMQVCLAPWVAPSPLPPPHSRRYGGR